MIFREKKFPTERENLMPDLSLKIIEKLLLKLKDMSFMPFHIDFVSIGVDKWKSNVGLTGIIAQELFFFMSLNLFFERNHVDPCKSST